MTKKYRRGDEGQKEFLDKILEQLKMPVSDVKATLEFSEPVVTVTELDDPVVKEMKEILLPESEQKMKEQIWAHGGPITSSASIPEIARLRKEVAQLDQKLDDIMKFLRTGRL